MAVNPQFLVDNSAWNRLSNDPVAERLRPLVDASLVATCAALEIEALYSAKDPGDYEKLRTLRAGIFTYVETEDRDWQRALEVQRELARQSQHRGPKIPDLIIAAVAENNDLTLLHFDSDFDRIVKLTGQKAEWVVPRGAVQ